MRVAQQSYEPTRKILIPRHRPKRRAVTMNQHRPALQHTPEHLPAALRTMKPHGNLALAVGMARTDNRHRKSLRTIIVHQPLLTRNLVARILPVGISQRRALTDKIMPHRLVTGRCRTDKDILARAATKQPEVALHLLSPEAHKLAHGIKHHITQQTVHRRLIMDVGHHQPHPLGKLLPPMTTVEHPHIVPLRSQLPSHRTANRTRSANQ